MECNPFHLGHKYIINYARNILKIDYIIIILSGNFVQRGEPAIFDKYKRTKELIENNVDLVIELPVEFSLSSAKYFANASINIINKLKFVDCLLFGSEIADIDTLNKISNKINNISNNKFKNLLSKGYSYPKIITNIIDEKLAPNDILGIEYLSCINNTKSKIKPICLKRNNTFHTATEIRNKIKNKTVLNDFSECLNYKLFYLYHNNFDFCNYYNINEDLKNKIIKTINKNISFEERASLLHTKETTLANIKRNLLHILLDIKQKNIEIMKFGNNIKYLRILGINNNSKNILKFIKMPYLLSYTKKELNKYFYPKKINQSIKKNIFSSNLYYYISNIETNEYTSKIIT